MPDEADRSDKAILDRIAEGIDREAAKPPSRSSITPSVTGVETAPKTEPGTAARTVRRTTCDTTRHDGVMERRMTDG